MKDVNMGPGSSGTPGRRVSRRQVLRITAVAGVSLALGGSLTAALLRQAGLHRVRITRTQMGTRVTVTALHPDPEAARTMVETAFAEMDRLEALLSRHRPETPVRRLAREGVLWGAPPELVEVLKRAGEYSRLTGGAFDVTVAPLLDLYEAGFRGRSRAPGPSEVAAALLLVDYRRLTVEDGVVALERPGMAITLDGIAKGYVVDRTVATVVDAGAERVIVEAGGDIAAEGRGMEDGEGWRIGIRDPHQAGRTLGSFRLRGEGVATSGDYVQTFTQDRRLHHILDPRTGTSPDHTSGVTVLAPTAMDADALSTSVFVMGPAEGLALLERLDRVEGLIVTKEGGVLGTSGFPREA